jgi:hypothetical protein
LKPGPGTYNLEKHKTKANKCKKCGQKYYKMNYQNMCGICKNNDHWKSPYKVPGPSKYKLNFLYFDKTPKVSIGKSKRVIKLSTATIVPGPGAYNHIINNLIH